MVLQIKYPPNEFGKTKDNSRDSLPQFVHCQVNRYLLLQALNIFNFSHNLCDI